MKFSVLFSSGSNFRRLLPFYLFFILVTLSVSQNSFFWDKDIIISRQAFWMLDHNYSIILPDNLDTGFPPLLAFLLALSWKIFGTGLFVSHLLMLPFSLILIYQLKVFIDNFFQDKNMLYPVLFLVIINTVLLSQIIVVSTDLLLVVFFFLSVNSIHKKRPYLLAFALTGLALSHLRGIMTVVAVWIYHLYYIFYNGKQKINFRELITLSVPYFPSALVILAYYTVHFISKGWLLVHADYPWLGCLERVGFRGFLRNIGIVGWRLVDFGNIFLWLVIFYLFFKKIFRKRKPDPGLKALVFLTLVILAVNLPTMLLYKVLAGHRYLILIYILLSVIAGYFLSMVNNRKTFNIIYLILIAGIFSGNFWIYPDHIAKGWDATIAHLPYYSLRHKMIDYIEEQGIPFEKIGSEVPNNGKLKYIDLVDDDRSFPKKDFKKQEYIFYSNIYNMFTDEELEELKNQWILVKEFRMMQVYVALYKKPYERKK